MLRERLNFLVKDTALYGIANAASRFLLFLTLPIIVNVISAAEFGAWNILTIVGLVISAVTMFGTDSAVVRYFYDGDTEEHHRKVFTHGLAIQAILILALLSFSLLGPGVFLKVVALDGKYSTCMQLILAWVPANVLVQYCQNWFKWTFQRVRFLSMSIGLASLNLLLLFTCANSYQVDLRIILVINVASYWAFALIGLIWCRKFISIKIDAVMIKGLLSFGLPMMLVMLVNNLTTSLDRLFLARYMTASELGVYSFGQKISIIMLVVVTAFQTAFGPFAFSIWEKPDAKQTFARFQSYYLMACGIIGIAICSCIKPLIIIVGSEEYLTSAEYVFVLIEAVMLYGLYSFASLGIFYSKRMRNNLLALFIGLGVNYGVNQLLIPDFLGYGAAIGFLAGNLSLVVAGYIFSQKSYLIPFAYYGDALKILIVSAMLVLTTIPFRDDIYIDALIKLLTLVPLFLVLSYGMLNRDERKFILDLLRNRG